MGSRRTRGEGSATRLPNGTWQGRVRSGKRSYTATAPTKKEALEKAKTKYQQQEQIAGATVGHIASLWLATPGWTDTTRGTYTSRWENHLQGHWASKPINTLTAKAIADWTATLDATERTKTTAIQTLSAILTEAQRLGYTDHNPAKVVRKPKAKRVKPAPMTPEQAAQFLAHTEGTRFHGVYAVMIYAGLRSKEARHLQPDDIQDGMIHIRRENTKTDAGERHVPIVPALAPILEQVVAQSQGNGSKWLWPSNGGTPCPAASLYLDYKKQLAECGIDDRRIHDLRHTCGSTLTAQGVPLRIVQAILGHTRADQTMHYSRQHDEQLKAAVANLPAL